MAGARWPSLADADMRRLLLASAALRLALIVYGEWQDRTMQVKFTDIDYVVFTDGARFVYEGGSPYQRATYRYTPLLAWLLVPNVFVPFFGKVLFAAVDLVCGMMIFELLQARQIEGRKAAAWSALWLLNPLVFVISTRGNAESLVSALVLGTLLALFRRRMSLCAVLFGAAVHLKTYPVIYALPIFFFLDERYPSTVDPRAAAPRGASGRKGFLARLLLPIRLKFALTSAAVFFALCALCYALYGNEFLDESLLYHLVRRDHRHNFSPYWYYIYLSFEESASLVVSLAAFLPQVLLLTWIGYAYRRDLFFCLFLMTFVFVTFNKVCTSQYFAWFLAFLPLVLPFSELAGRRRLRLAAMGALWAASQAVWLHFAYRLEILGLPAYAQTWAASVFFFVSNIVLAGEFIKYQHAPAAAPSAVGPAQPQRGSRPLPATAKPATR